MKRTQKVPDPTKLTFQLWEINKQAKKKKNQTDQSYVGGKANKQNLDDDTERV